MPTLEELVLRITEQGAEETSRRIRGVNDSIGGLGTNVRRLGAMQVGQVLQNLGQGISNVGRGIKTMLTDNIIKLGIAAIKTSMDFEAGMTKVRSISGATEKDMGLLTEKAKEMGLKTKFSATEASEAFKYMAMAGWKTGDMLEGIEPIMNLAAASGEELSLVSDIVTDSLTAFGMTAKDTGAYVDLLTNTANNSNTSISLMGESFKYAAPVMGAAGYTAEDTALALGLMANGGIKASQAGTTLRSAITNLVKPTKQASVWIKRLDIEMTDSKGNMLPFKDVLGDLRTKFKGLSKEQQLQASSAIFGKTAMSGMLTVLNASDKDYKKLIKTTTDYNGAAKKTADIMLKSLSGQFKILQSTVEGLAIKVGDLLLPYIKILVGWFQKLANNLFKLSPSMQKIILVIAGLLAGVGPLIMAMGTLVTIVGVATAVIAAVGWPVAAAVAAIIPLVMGITGIGVAVTGAAIKLGILQKVFEFFKNVIKSVFLIFTGDGKTAFEILTQKLGMSNEKASQFRATFVRLRETLNLVKMVIGNVKDLIATIFTNDQQAMVDILINKFGMSKDEAEKFKTTVINLRTKIYELGEKLKEVATDIIMKFGEKIRELAYKVYENRAEIARFIGGLMRLIGVFLDVGRGALILGQKVVAGFKAVKTLFTVTIPKIITDALWWFALLPVRALLKINELKNGALAKFAELKAKAISRIRELVNGISSKANDAKNAAIKLGNSIKSAIDGVIKNAKKWGQNVVQGLIDGIVSMVNGVGTAAGKIADKIKSKIGWSSPTKEGPGADSDKWAPNLMKMFTEGLVEYIPKIEIAALKVAQAVDLSSLQPANQIVQNTQQVVPNLGNEEFNMYGNITLDMSKIRDIDDIISIFKNLKMERVARGGAN